jgi:caa(3)-type oxidase subunit IV
MSSATTAGGGAGYGIYWRIWGILLVVTLIMIFIDRPTAQAIGKVEGGGPQAVLVGVLIVAMLLKAFLISSYFMHLRFERLMIGLAVLVGLLINGAILFLLMVPDGLRIFGMVGPPAS